MSLRLTEHAFLNSVSIVCVAKRDKMLGAGGVVFNAEGEVLVLGHRDGSWVFPKGHIDEDETFEQAALREVEEESGVEATIVDGAQTERTRYTNAKGEKREITWYLMRTGAQSLVLREKTFPEGNFFTPDAALEKLSFDEDKRLLSVMLDKAGL